MKIETKFNVGDAVFPVETLIFYNCTKETKYVDSPFIVESILVRIDKRLSACVGL